MAEIGGGLGGGDGEALDGAAVGEGMEIWTICCFHFRKSEKRERRESSYEDYARS
jgi:hypothetical protein